MIWYDVYSDGKVLAKFDTRDEAQEFGSNLSPDVDWQLRKIEVTDDPNDPHYANVKAWIVGGVTSMSRDPFNR